MDKTERSSLPSGISVIVQKGILLLGEVNLSPIKPWYSVFGIIMQYADLQDDQDDFCNILGFGPAVSSVFRQICTRLNQR